MPGDESVHRISNRSGAPATDGGDAGGGSPQSTQDEERGVAAQVQLIARGDDDARGVERAIGVIQSLYDLPTAPEASAVFDASFLPPMEMRSF